MRSLVWNISNPGNFMRILLQQPQGFPFTCVCPQMVSIPWSVAILMAKGCKRWYLFIWLKKNQRVWFWQPQAPGMLPLVHQHHSSFVFFARLKGAGKVTRGAALTADSSRASSRGISQGYSAEAGGCGGFVHGLLRPVLLKGFRPIP